MGKKHKCKCPEGVPEWVVTFGDMMSLLLAFFVLLFSMSEIKKDTPKYKRTVKAVQQQFGFKGQSGSVPVDDVPLSEIIVLEQAAKAEKIREISASEDPSIHGRHTTVTRVNEGLKFTVGGIITFEPGSAELKPEAKEQLTTLSRVILGKNNKIDVRGHATGGDQVEGAEYASLDALSFARAKAVKDFLTMPGNGIREQRIRLVSCGTHEPLKERAYSKMQQQINRRVEIYVLETLIKDFTPKENAADTPAK